MTPGTSILDHPSIRAVRGSPPVVLRSDGTPGLPTPVPPASGAERAVRRLALAGTLPSIAPAIPAIPAGWTGLLEVAAHALDSQGLACGLRFLRSDARWGVLTLWPDTEDEALGPCAADAIEAICEWAEARSGGICMAHGTPDARLAIVGGLRLALGPRARGLPALELGRLIWPDRRRDRSGIAEDHDP